MRNANKSPKIHSALAREVEKWSGIRIQEQIATNHNTKFKWNWLITFAVILHTNGIPRRDTEWQTE